MRLLIDPGRADQAGSNAAVVLTYRTKVSETVSGVVVERQPTEAVKTVLRSQLEQMIRAYPGDDPAFGNMVVDERHGAQRSLRCAVGRLFAAHGNLPDATRHLHAAAAGRLRVDRRAGGDARAGCRSCAAVDRCGLDRPLEQRVGVHLPEQRRRVSAARPGGDADRGGAGGSSGRRTVGE